MESINCARVLKALADDTRLKILEMLFNGEFSVSEIAEYTGVEYSQASHHLCVLRNAGLVLDSKEGKYVMYRLHPVCYHNGHEKKNILNFNCCKIEFGNASFIKNKNA